MRQGSFQYVGNNFHVTMRVSRKASAGDNPIFVDDSEVAKAHVMRIVIVAEREGVTAVEPIKFGKASLGGSSDGDHFSSDQFPVKASIGYCVSPTYSRPAPMRTAIEISLSRA